MQTFEIYFGLELERESSASRSWMMLDIYSYMDIYRLE